ncbi:hypothetical protein ACXO7Q_04505 [Lactobacillus delbrueckii subsp. bulgaricus]
MMILLDWFSLCKRWIGFRDKKECANARSVFRQSLVFAKRFLEKKYFPFARM